MSLLLKRLGAVLAISAFALLAYCAWYLLAPVRVAQLPAEFEIPQGAGLRAAIGVLEQAGVDAGGARFELLARALGQAKSIRAGNYQVARPVTPRQLLGRLTRGDVMQSEVTLIEGWNIRQVRAALDGHPDLRHNTRELEDEDLLAKIEAAEAHPEGLFFPDTYLFAKGSSDIAVLRRAYRSMQRRLEAEWQARDPSVPYRSPYEALTMASIIEKETGTTAERDLIGGALVNRMRLGMRLQVDPTVIYGLGESFDGNLRKVHLLTDGPYNTYTRAGLPPTPIAMPGLGSLRSALRPAQTDALYYVARGDGTSEFSRTLREHNRAVAKYQLPPRRAPNRDAAGRR